MKRKNIKILFVCFLCYGVAVICCPFYLGNIETYHQLSKLFFNLETLK
jgi:hypothetical protein